jgi:hypothetical protein
MRAIFYGAEQQNAHLSAVTKWAFKLFKMPHIDDDEKREQSELRNYIIKISREEKKRERER